MLKAYEILIEHLTEIEACNFSKAFSMHAKLFLLLHVWRAKRSVSLPRKVSRLDYESTLRFGGKMACGDTQIRQFSGGNGNWRIELDRVRSQLRGTVCVRGYNIYSQDIYLLHHLLSYRVFLTCVPSLCSACNYFRRISFHFPCPIHSGAVIN